MQVAIAKNLKTKEILELDVKMMCGKKQNWIKFALEG